MKIMLIGKTGAGKTTLKQKLLGKEIKYHKTQMVDYDENIIDTPGEYIENKGYYRALNVVSMDAEVIVFIQSATDEDTLFPPNFTNMFLGKKIVGVITKGDLVGDKKRAEMFLKNAGVNEIVEMNENEESIEKLKKILY
ncbi:EutP/PduV family microcompartment system protein [Cetobacterium sp. SF1]|uniref:EutP/PduV family microcompartment system protein n=1 Tax=unclassified Cetobacterium TaxID=2630983 RepID=UPI003CF0DD9E